MNSQSDNSTIDPRGELRKAIHDAIWEDGPGYELLAKTGHEKIDRVEELFDRYADQRVAEALDSIVWPEKRRYAPNTRAIDVVNMPIIAFNDAIDLCKQAAIQSHKPTGGEHE